MDFMVFELKTLQSQNVWDDIWSESLIVIFVTFPHIYDWIVKEKHTVPN